LWNAELRGTSEGYCCKDHGGQLTSHCQPLNLRGWLCSYSPGSVIWCKYVCKAAFCRMHESSRRTSTISLSVSLHMVRTYPVLPTTISFPIGITKSIEANRSNGQRRDFYHGIKIHPRPSFIQKHWIKSVPSPAAGQQTLLHLELVHYLLPGLDSSARDCQVRVILVWDPRTTQIALFCVAMRQFVKRQQSSQRFGQVRSMVSSM